MTKKGRSQLYRSAFLPSMLLGALLTLRSVGYGTERFNPGRILWEGSAKVPLQSPHISPLSGYDFGLSVFVLCAQKLKTQRSRPSFRPLLIERPLCGEKARLWLRSSAISLYEGKAFKKKLQKSDS